MSLCEFEAGLVYNVSFRTAEVLQEKPCPTERKKTPGTSKVCEQQLAREGPFGVVVMTPRV